MQIICSRNSRNTSRLHQDKILESKSKVAQTDIKYFYILWQNMTTLFLIFKFSGHPVINWIKLSQLHSDRLQLAPRPGGPALYFVHGSLDWNGVRGERRKQSTSLHLGRILKHSHLLTTSQGVIQKGVNRRYQQPRYIRANCEDMQDTWTWKIMQNTHA